MGRREKALDPEEGPVQRFASELRELRQKAGSPTYRAMAQRTGYSVPTLSRAADGKQLPTLPVVLSYVEACGAAREEWERRWHEAAREVAAERVAGGGRAPYPGLARFEPDDAERFFGRKQLLQELLDLVRAHRVTVVFGPSGSGKSSLLRAGLIPALREPGALSEPLAALRIFTPGERPVGDGQERLTPKQAEGETVVIVDQFEEVFTLCRVPEEREEFTRLLVAADQPASRLRVVVAVRADFYARCLQHAGLAAAVNQASLAVGPMGPAELRQAVVRPAAAYGLIVERALTTRILEDVAGEAGGLPLMSHALLETWRRRRARTLTLDGYEAVGGVHGAVARTAETTYAGLSPAQQDLARRILLRLITPGEGAPDTRRPTDQAELDFGSPQETAAVLEHLTRARLLTVDDGIVDLAHEALITAWPRLSGWVDTDRDRLRLHRRLTQDAHAWRDLGNDGGALYRGSRLTRAVEAFPSGERDHLTPLERSFLLASLEARERERRASARAARRLRVFAGTVSLLLVVTVIAAVTAVQQQRSAASAQSVSRSRLLAAQSAALVASDPELAALLAVAAYRTSPTLEATGSLYAAAVPLRHRLAPGAGPVSAAAFGPDGTVLALSGPEGTVSLWDVTTGDRLFVLSDADVAEALAFSSDGALLATGSDQEGRVEVWDTVTGERVRVMGGPEIWAKSLAFGSDGATLTAVGDDGTVLVWDAATGAVRAALDSEPATLDAVALSPDGALLATGSTDNDIVRLWDVATGRKLRDLTGTGDVESVTFSPDGSTLAAASANGLVRLWDVATGVRLRDLSEHEARVGMVAFDGDGSTVAIGSADGTIRFWDIASGQALHALAQPEGVDWLALAPDGSTLGAGTDDGAARLWDTATVLSRHTLTSHTGGVSSVALHPEGTVLATGDSDGTVRLWDATTGRLRHTLTGHAGDVHGMAFGPDGDVLATASADGTVRLWDATTGQLHLTLTDLDTTGSLVFSPDGTALATRSPSGWAQVRDATTGQILPTLNTVGSSTPRPDGPLSPSRTRIALSGCGT